MSAAACAAAGAAGMRRCSARRLTPVQLLTLVLPRPRRPSECCRSNNRNGCTQDGGFRAQLTVTGNRYYYFVVAPYSTSLPTAFRLGIAVWRATG